MKRIAIACLATLAAMMPAHADKLVAVSKTAVSITGDIEMDDYEIVFSNGQKLAFSDLVSYELDVDGKTVDASVYKVGTPVDPVLLRGNKLCGSGEVTYVASWFGTDDITMVAVFATPGVPKSSGEMCASYSYETE